MTGRVIVLNDKPLGAALLVNGRLEDLVLVAPDDRPEPGDILSARVVRKLPNSGAFCALPRGTEGYLRDVTQVREGDRFLVQIVSLPEPGKAVPVTTRLLFKGPRLILTPGAPGVNVSRRIGNEAERARLTGIVGAALAERAIEGAGVIVRTEARGEEPDRLVRELGWLSASANSADRDEPGSPGGPPGRAAHRLMNLPLSAWLFPLPEAIVAPPGLSRVLATTDPDLGPVWFWGDERFLERLRAEDDPFAALGVHEAIADLARPEVPLGPGRMTIEPTRALVAVDVDTGADFSPAAGLKANLAALAELPRQLRLRGLGGQIVIDCAPMGKSHRRACEEAAKKALRADPVETALLGWTPLGHLELRRKRERRPLDARCLP